LFEQEAVDGLLAVSLRTSSTPRELFSSLGVPDSTEVEVGFNFRVVEEDELNITFAGIADAVLVAELLKVSLE